MRSWHPPCSSLQTSLPHGNTPLLPTNTFTKKVCFHLSNHRWGWVKITYTSTTSRYPQVFFDAWPSIVDLIFQTATCRERVDSQPNQCSWRNFPKNPKQTRQCFAIPTPDITCPIKLSDVSEIWEIRVSTAWRWLHFQAVTWGMKGGIPLSSPKQQLFAQLKIMSNWSIKKKTW